MLLFACWCKTLDDMFCFAFWESERWERAIKSRVATRKFFCVESLFDRNVNHTTAGISSPLSFTVYSETVDAFIDLFQIFARVEKHPLTVGWHVICRASAVFWVEGFSSELMDWGCKNFSSWLFPKLIHFRMRLWTTRIWILCTLSGCSLGQIRSRAGIEIVTLAVAHQSKSTLCSFIHLVFAL